MPRWKRRPNKTLLMILMILLFLIISVLAYWILPGAALSLNPVMVFLFLISAIAQAVTISKPWEKDKKRDKWLRAGLGMAAISMSVVALVAVHLIFR